MCETTKGVIRTLFPCERLAADLLPKYKRSQKWKSNRRWFKKWKVLRDVEPTLVEGCTPNFHPVLLDCELEVYRSETFFSRAEAKNALLGLADAKLVLDNQRLIPIKMRGKRLHFPGTLFRCPLGYIYFPYLLWNGKWHPAFYRLESGYTGWGERDWFVSK